MQGLPMAVSKTSVLGPSKIQICQKWFKIYENNWIFQKDHTSELSCLLDWGFVFAGLCLPDWIIYNNI